MNEATRRYLAVLCALSVTTLAVVTLSGAPARAQTAPPAGYAAGTGNFEGTESVIDEHFVGGTGCAIENNRTVFALRGAGTFHGVAASGQTVVYNVQIQAGQTLYGNGPLHIEVESTETYYHGPNGTYGTDSTCSSASLGASVTAEFRVWAPDNVYRLDAGGAQIPCVGHGTFARSDGGADWHAQWTMDSDCTVVGNAAGTPGNGLAKAGTGFTDQGSHSPCFDAPCLNNLKFDYVQYLPYIGLHLGLTGPASVKVNTQAIMTAALTQDGLAVPDAQMTFSVTGPGAISPSGATVTTGADGRAAFSFTTATIGDYVVTAATPSTASPGQTLAASQTVQFTPPPPPAVTLSGPSAAQTQENVYVAATLTNNDALVANVQVTFSVTGPGTATPASGTVMTDSHGIAAFSFIGDRAGNYAVNASATYLSQHPTDSLTIPLQINTFSHEADVTFPSGEQTLRAAAIDPTGDYAYFGDSAGVEKIDLHTFQRADLLSVGPASDTALMDPAGHYAYFGQNANSLPPTILKVDLSSFQVVGRLTLPSGEPVLRSAAIDPAGRYAYYGFGFSPSDVGRVAKIDLDTFQQVGVLTLASDEASVDTALMSPAGDFAYFGTRGAQSQPARLVKVDLGTFQQVGALPMADSNESLMRHALIDPEGHFAYLPVDQASGSPIPGRIVKVDLTTFQRVSAVTLEAFSPYFLSNEDNLFASVMDPAGNFAYFGMNDSSSPQARILRLDLRTFEKLSPITFTAAEAGNGFRSAVIAPDGNHAYFGTDALRPGKVLEIALSRPPNSALAAGNDTYATNYLTPLSVAAPGLLANDVNNADAYPLMAGRTSTPAHGSVSLAADGSFIYTPDVGFSGTDTFTYTVNNAKDYSPPATVLVTVGAAPQGVSSVGGGAMGWYTNVGLFGGPQSVKGGSGSTCGQGGQPACATGQSPSVTLPAAGADLSATDPDGNLGQYGPAYIFENHGPITVHAQGATGPGGSATSAASVKDIEDNYPFLAAGTDGEVSSTCTANESVLSGSAHIVNGTLVLHTDPTTGEASQTLTLPHDFDPPPNTQYDGALDHVGDQWRIVLNEQLLGPESITVNALHMYLLGPTAVGDMIIGQSRCSVATSQANSPPVAHDDGYLATAGQVLIVPGAGLLANDTDADGQPLRASNVLPAPPPTSGGGVWTFPSNPAHGTVTLNGDGSFTYVAKRDFSGTDSFTYLVTDSRGKSDTGAVTLTVAPAPTPHVVADFDGNASTDLSLFRPSTGAWYVGNNAPTYLGLSGDVAGPCDYDGDGTTDLAVFRDGAWYAGTNAPVFLGLHGDVPVPGDYDGDGRCDLAVFRPSTGAWYIGSNGPVFLGLSGDVPVPGDFDGDGRTDLAVFRPSTGAWYIGSNAPVFLGLSGDVPVPGDYDGNVTTDLAVFRPSTGAWYVGANAAVYLGLTGDVPVPGDYDGNGTIDLAAFRPSTGAWYVGNEAPQYLGLPGDDPLPLPAAIRQYVAS